MSRSLNQTAGEHRPVGLPRGVVGSVGPGVLTCVRTYARNLVFPLAWPAMQMTPKILISFLTEPKSDEWRIAAPTRSDPPTRPVRSIGGGCKCKLHHRELLYMLPPARDPRGEGFWLGFGEGAEGAAVISRSLSSFWLLSLFFFSSSSARGLFVLPYPAACCCSDSRPYDGLPRRIGSGLLFLLSRYFCSLLPFFILGLIVCSYWLIEAAIPGFFASNPPCISSST